MTEIQHRNNGPMCREIKYAHPVAALASGLVILEVGCWHGHQATIRIQEPSAERAVEPEPMVDTGQRCDVCGGPLPVRADGRGNATRLRCSGRCARAADRRANRERRLARQAAEALGVPA